MKILVTGSNGMLGSEILKVHINEKIKIIGVTRNDFDITNYEQMFNFIKNILPDVIIHCAAYTNVDEAEKNQELVFKINANATLDIAQICSKLNIKLIYISTDYVFDGKKNAPYYEYDLPNPINVYGMSKYYGEQFILKNCLKSFIVRTSWLFGKNGKNFVNTILTLTKNNKTLKVVCDQIGSPTYTKDLAKILVNLAKTEKYGIYHITNEGFCSWYEFANEILKIKNISNVEVIPITSNHLNSLAKRPKNSMLYKINILNNGFNKLRHWTLALDEYLNSLNN